MYKNTIANGRLHRGPNKEQLQTPLNL